MQSSDKFKSRFTKDGRDQYSWCVSSHWALKHDVTDENSVNGKEQMFQ
jgi:hypothetical protein